MNLTSKQRAYLRSQANHVEALFQVGKSSLTPELTNAVGEAFNTREIIKLSVLKNCLDDPRELGEMIAERTESTFVCSIGKKIILYKPFKDKPEIVLPKA
ncbi:MAG: YhbY family RNA-binding protein [Lachnospiraceae bacterium]|nr:YhbY family RNA-binding protein [Lachnospiraceae bacterium]